MLFALIFLIFECKSTDMNQNNTIEYIKGENNSATAESLLEDQIDLIIPEFVQHIEDCLLNACPIGYTVTKIGDYFADGKKITGQVILPNSILSIGKHSFENQDIKSIQLGNSLISIGSNAFSSCNRLTQITFPDTLTEIGAFSFAQCSELSHIFNAKNINLINEYSFYECTKLGSIDLYNVSVCEKFAFANCYSLTSIGENTPNLIYIGSFCFSECKSLLNISLNNRDLLIMPYSFYKCTSLSQVLHINVEKISGSIIPYCTSIQYIQFGLNVKHIGAGLLNNCPNVHSLIFLEKTPISKDPDGLIIGDHAFEDCVQIKKMNLPRHTIQILDYAFCGCENLNIFLNFSESIEIIGDHAFERAGIYGINISHSNKLKAIGKYTFFNCPNLFCNIVFPSSIIEIGECAFSYSPITGDIKLQEGVVRVGLAAFKGCDNAKGELFLPNSLIIIEDYAFSNSAILGTLVFPNKLKIIGNYAFAHDSGIIGPVVIPKSVERVGNSAFLKCTGISEITFNNKSMEVGDHAFSHVEAKCFNNIPKDCEHRTNNTSCYDSENYKISECSTLKWYNFIKWFLIIFNTLASGAVVYLITATFNLFIGPSKMRQVFMARINTVLTNGKNQTDKIEKFYKGIISKDRIKNKKLEIIEKTWTNINDIIKDFSEEYNMYGENLFPFLEFFTKFYIKNAIFNNWKDINIKDQDKIIEESIKEIKFITWKDVLRKSFSYAFGFFCNKKKNQPNQSLLEEGDSNLYIQL